MEKPTYLVAVEQPELVTRLEGVLQEAGIPYLSGLQAEPNPMVVFTVDEADVSRARAAVEVMLRERAAAYEREQPAQAVDISTRRGPAAETDADDEGDDAFYEADPTALTFPRGPLQAALGLVLLHFAALFGLVGRAPTTEHLAAVGGLVRTSSLFEPWRLITSLFVHADIRHVAANAVSLVVFAVPVIGWLGWTRSAAVYLLAGVAGGIAAVASNAPGTVIVGSSGAVAGLFGAWLAITLVRARRAPLSRRATIRAVGIGLLVLPTLITPRTAEGQSISVAAHLGGALAGGLFALIVEALRSRDGHGGGVS